MADAPIGQTETTAVSQAAIANLVQSFLIQESVMANKVTDYSYLAMAGVKSIGIPRSGGFTVSAKAENTQSVLTDELSYAADTITLSSHRKVQWLLEDFASVQAVPAIVTDAVMKATKALAKDLDDIIIAALIAGASASNPDHIIQYADTTGEDLDLADILRIRALLQGQNINPMECYLGISPAQEKNLLGISNFIEAYKWGDSAPIQNGVIGKIFGMQVIVTNGLTTTTIAWHPSALGLAVQIPPRLQTQLALRDLGMLYSLDTKFGVAVLDAGKRNVNMIETP